MDLLFNIWATNWQWLVPLIVGVVALVLAVSPALQMFYGKPRITIEFNVDDTQGERILVCEFYNYPLHTKSILNRIGVRRETVDDIMAHLSISEFKTDKVIAPGIVPKMRTYTGVYVQRVSLPASVIPVTFGVAYHLNNKVRPFEEETTIELGIGKYVAHIEVVAGNRVTRGKGIFVVGESHPYIWWKDNEEG